MKSIFTRAALLCFLACAAIPAHAQFERWPGALKQYELGYGLSWGTADYTVKYRAVTEGGIAMDTTVTTSVKTKGGFTGIVGTSLRLKRLGRISTLALGANLVYNGYLWDFPVLSGAAVSDTGFRFVYDDAFSFDGASVNAGLALTADFKFGVDAMMDKNYRWGWTGGIGVIPSMNATTGDGIDADFKFGVQPVLKTEVSLLAGIVFKLRLQYAFGNITYFDKSSDGLILGSKAQTQIIGKSNFTVGLLVLPFSFMYKKSEWYNSY